MDEPDGSLPAFPSIGEASQERIPSLTSSRSRPIGEQSASSQSQYVIAEEYTVGVPLFRPNRQFLEVLRLAGSTGEVFTRKEICHYLKEYISARKLYDETDPRVVHCQGDLLEQLFNTKKFTIFEVLGFINKNCCQLPDMCIKRKQHLVSADSFPFAPPNGEQSSVSKSSLTIEICNEARDQVITSTTLPSTSKQSTKLHSPIQSTGSSRKRKRIKSERGSSGSSSSNNRRKTSVSVTYSDNDASAYPWYFKVKMDPFSDQDERHSREDQDTVAASVQSADFSVEYEVDAGSDSSISNSNEDNISGEEVRVICNESDVEFWADSSAADSDTELTAADKWDCPECYITNSAIVRYCERCWKLRPGWLPEKVAAVKKEKARKFRRSNSAPGVFSSSENSDVISNLPNKFHLRKNDTIGDNINCKSTVQPYKSEKQFGIDHRKESSQNKTSADNKTSEKCNLFKQESLSESANISNDETHDDSGYHGSSATISSRETKGSAQLLLSQDTINVEHRNTFLNYQQSNKCVDMKSQTEGSNDTILLSACNSENDTEIKSGCFIGGDNESKQNEPPYQAGEMCVICFEKPKTGCIIHGSTGHQVCCYRCARRLKRQRLPCPVCRRIIQKVIKNYIL